MKIVDPDDQTTLLLNKFQEPFGVCTAKAAFRHLITGRVVGVDASDVHYSWDGYATDLPREERMKLRPSYINWQSGNVQIFEDQPALRSAPDFDGKEKAWFIPTIARCNHQFGYRVRGNRDISLRKCYEIYRKVCQYCMKPIPFSEATKDHLYPKSRGGSNHEFNIVLACRRCNNNKDSQFPVLNVNGEEVKPRKALPSGMFLPPDNLLRTEWKKYLFLE